MLCQPGTLIRFLLAGVAVLEVGTRGVFFCSQLLLLKYVIIHKSKPNARVDKTECLALSAD